MKMKTTAEYSAAKKPYDDDDNAPTYKLKYFNLKTESSDTIESYDSDMEDLNKLSEDPEKDEKYTFLCVDENNKPIYDYSSKELSKFTKKYFKNQDYNPNIIYDIIYAKINNNKVFV